MKKPVVALCAFVVAVAAFLIGAGQSTTPAASNFSNATITGGTISGTAISGGTIAGATITNSPISGNTGSFTTSTAGMNIGSQTVTVTVQASAGTGASAVCFTTPGNQCTLTSGLIEVITGTSAVAGDQVEVATTGAATAKPLNCVTQGAGTSANSASALNPSVDETGLTNGQFFLYSSAVPTSSHTYLYFYVCGE